ncbi:MAG TPA: 50S ribosomal protein L11 methyltransferase [Candidatus Kryptonia bacterium]
MKTTAEKYFQLKVTSDSSINDLIVGFLSDVGAEGFIEEGNELICYLAEDKWKPGYKDDLVEFLSRLKAERKIETFTVDLSEVMNRDWNSLWEESIVPVEVTENIVIKPSWKTYYGAAKIVIEIDPKMSFGTGHHETTRMMIKLLEKYVHNGNTVLDIGTGTGVLAIAAVKVGAKTCVAVDNDEWSIVNARENISRNGVESAVDLMFGEVGKVPDRQFDIVMSNLNRNTLIYIKSEIARRCCGLLMLSGILTLDEKSIVDEFASVGFKLIESLKNAEWSALVLKR